MIWNLLNAAEGATEGATEGAGGGGSNTWILVVFGIILVMFIVYMMSSGKKGKQRQKEYLEMLEAIQPGNKVKTIGGICGIVAEVCDDNTIIIETGSELTGKSYVKMDKEMIAQTDAKGPTQLAREEAEAQKRAAKAAKDPNAKPVLPEHPEPTAEPEAETPETVSQSKPESEEK